MDLRGGIMNDKDKTRGELIAEIEALKRRLRRAEERSRRDGREARATKEGPAIIDLLPDPTFAIDSEGRITSWNRAMEKLTGRRSSDMLGKGNYEYAIPFYGVRRPILIDLVLKGDRSSLEMYNNVRWFDNFITAEIIRDETSAENSLWGSASILTDDEGKVVGAIETIRHNREDGKAEEELRQTRNYLENLLDYANAPVIVWDPSFRITRFNHAFERLTGYRSEEVIGRELALLFPETSREDTLAQIQRTLAGEYWETVEIPILRKDGGIRIALWNSANIYMDDGRTLVSTIAQGQDITERKQVESEKTLNAVRTQVLLDLNALAERPSERIFDFALEASLKVTQSEYSFVGLLNAEETVMTIYRWSTQAMKQCALSDKPIHYPIGEAGIWGDCIRERRPVYFNDYSASYVHKRGIPAGHVPISRFLAVPILDGAGIVAIAAVANKTADYVADDVSALTTLYNKVWEILKRHQAEEALKETSDYLEKLINYANAPIIVWDQNSRITRFNHAFERLTGYAAEEVIGQDLALLFPEMSRTESLANIRRTLAGEYWETVEIPILRKDGDVRIALWNSANIYAKDGKTLVSTIAQGQDITYRKRTEEELVKIRKLESVGILAGGIAHDFNNLLAVVLGSISLAKMHAGPEDKIYDILERAEKACFQSKELTKRLIIFSKGGEPIRSVLSISQLLRESVDLFLRGSNVKCEFHLSADLWPVEIDEGQIRQMIQNLVFNARDAMPEGGTLSIGAENVSLKDP
ncbi:MAG: PAS domain S-box protein, partial [Smithellaceae bacterium]|nr:PAS domain S-box protein [Smithellaceae bacterium]